jgi:hypothetical protein
MRPVWLIESGVYGDEIVPFLAEVRRQGMIAQVVPYQALRQGASLAIDGAVLVPDACVIGYGTLPFGRQI